MFKQAKMYMFMLTFTICLLWRDFSIGKIRVTYDVELKKKAIDLYLKDATNYIILLYTFIGITRSGYYK